MPSPLLPSLRAWRLPQGPPWRRTTGPTSLSSSYCPTRRVATSMALRASSPSSCRLCSCSLSSSTTGPVPGGVIAGGAVARSVLDGYTFFMGAKGPLLFAPTVFKRNVYDWKKDFAPVSSVSFTPLVLQVHPSTPYKTVAD